MLNIFLCSSRSALQDEDFTYAIETPAGTSPSRKKTSLNVGRKKAAKMQIGSPTDFKHENHMGYDEIAGMDIAKYQKEMEMRIAQMTQTTSVIAPSFPTQERQDQDVQQQSQQQQQQQYNNFTELASGRRTPSSTSSSPQRATTVKRKPVPSVIIASSSSESGEIPSPLPSPSVSIGRSAPASVKKPLVPLLGDKAGRTPYVTQTAKIRWDGAMSEIEKALREQD